MIHPALLNTITDHLVRPITPDMVSEKAKIFATSHLQVKCIGQCQELYMIFLDLKKAAKIVSRAGCWGPCCTSWDALKVSVCLMSAWPGRWRTVMSPIPSSLTTKVSSRAVFCLHHCSVLSCCLYQTDGVVMITFAVDIYGFASQFGQCSHQMPVNFAPDTHHGVWVPIIMFYIYNNVITCYCIIIIFSITNSIYVLRLVQLIILCQRLHILV